MRSWTPEHEPPHDLGARELGLNVFGHNDGARTLYERAGYATTEQTYRLAT